MKVFSGLAGGLALLLGVVAAALGPSPGNADGAWLQWGGATRDFVVHSAPLADAWPAAGGGAFDDSGGGRAALHDVSSRAGGG